MVAPLGQAFAAALGSELFQLVTAARVPILAAFGALTVAVLLAAAVRTALRLASTAPSQPAIPATAGGHRPAR